jgi:hypothetical protein
VLLTAVGVVLAIQLLGVRPPLSNRSDLILAGQDLPRSRMHYLYIALEVVKVGLLLAMAISTAAESM